MSAFTTLDDVAVAGKTVLVRLDLNVPMENGQVSDTTRIDRSMPTVRELRDKGARVVILSHLGRPKGERKPEFSQEALVAPLQQALGGTPVAFAEDCVGEPAERAVQALAPGQVLLLENLRYHKEEEKNDPGFAEQLARLGDVFVSDAFSAAHRAHASTVGIARHLPPVAGRLMQEELENLTAATESPRRPVTAIVGGAKVSTKLDVLYNLCAKVDVLVLGGGMANTFLHARGVDVAQSMCEHDMAEQARTIEVEATKRGCNLLLPVDGVVAQQLQQGAPSQTYSITHIPSDRMILDIGVETAKVIEHKLGSSATILWNGPLGAFEVPPFDAGTNRIARATAELTRTGDARSVAGGGDTVAALSRAAVLDQFSYVSTAGGAFLEWLEGKELPGVSILRKAA